MKVAVFMNTKELFRPDELPMLHNFLFKTKGEAIHYPKISVVLTRSLETGLSVYVMILKLYRLT